MAVRTRVPRCVLELEKYWFLSGFLPLDALVPPKPVDGTQEQPNAATDSTGDSDLEAEQLLFGGTTVSGDPDAGRRTWRELALRAFQPDPQLHAHVEEIVHEMEDHESEFIDPLHRPWRPREFLKTIESYLKMRCRADMNHCSHCGQMNPSEYKHCLRCRTELEIDTLEQAIEAGTVAGAMQLEGFRILPSPCIKFFLLCQTPGSATWNDDVAEVLRPLYMLFTSSRYLAGEVVLDTTEHHVQAAADLNNLNRHLNGSLAKGRAVVEELQKAVGKTSPEEIIGHWCKIADAALEAQQNLCLMIDAWEEFEGVRLDQWWDSVDSEPAPTIEPGPTDEESPTRMGDVPRLPSTSTS